MADDGANTAGSSEALESKIASALRIREAYLKEQADSLNMLKVRRLLEKDLGMENLALDVHKKFVRQHVCKILGVTSDGVENGLKAETADNDASVMEGIAADSASANQLKKDVEAAGLVKDNDTDDSPVPGLISGDEKTEQGIKNAEDDEYINEDVVKEALVKRTDYFRANLDNITLAGARRLLEDDLQLEKYSLDPFKKFISGELDEIIKPPPVSTSKVDKKKSSKKIVPKKASKKVSNEGSESSDAKSMESSEEDASSRKRITSKAKAGKKQPLDKTRKRKLATNETKGSRKKSKPQEKLNSDAEVDKNSSDIDESPSSSMKNKASTAVYGKRVEQLKSVIKSCGIRIPPVIYKRAKQAPENKQEAVLIKELEDILSKEGLSANPSEKEIKDVKKRKERERELEGIDMSNIVSSSRRRSTASFVAPVKPTLPIESDGSQSDDKDDDDGQDSDSDDNDDLKDEVDENDDIQDEVDENDDIKDEIDNNDDETKNGSQSEEHEEGKDED